MIKFNFYSMIQSYCVYVLNVFVFWQNTVLFSDVVNSCRLLREMKSRFHKENAFKKWSSIFYFSFFEHFTCIQCACYQIKIIWNITVENHLNANAGANAGGSIATDRKMKKQKKMILSFAPQNEEWERNDGNKHRQFMIDAICSWFDVLYM